MGKKKFSSCAKLLVWMLSVGAFLGSLFALIGGEGASLSKCSREYANNGISLDKLPAACARNKRGAPWLEGTCGNRDVSLTLWEYCDRPSSAAATAGYTCYDYVDHGKASFKTRAGLGAADKDFVKDFEEAASLITSALVFSMLLLAFGCMVLVDDDIDTGAKTTLTALLLCLAHVACCGAALALVQGSSVHGGAACDTKVRGSGVAALAVAMGCSALTLLLFFPCFCGPCAVCLEGGSDEEKEKRAGKEGICATICACTMAVSIAVATVVGIVYSSVRAVASKLWLVLWPLLCLPCCCLTKIMGKKLHPSYKVLKACTVLAVAVFGLLASALFGRRTAYRGQTTSLGGFGEPLAYAKCGDGTTLFVTLSEGCIAKTGASGIDCFDYADGVLPAGVFGSDASTKFHTALGQEAFAVLLVAGTLQLVCIFGLASIFSCVGCRRRPQAASVLVGFGLQAVTVLTLVGMLLVNSTALTSQWAPSSCSTSDLPEKMGPGTLMLVLAIVLNATIAALVHWPILVSMFSCLACCNAAICRACVDEDEDEDEKKEEEEASQEMGLKQTGAKHVV